MVFNSLKQLVSGTMRVNISGKSVTQLYIFLSGVDLLHIAEVLSPIKSPFRSCCTKYRNPNSV